MTVSARNQAPEGEKIVVENVLVTGGAGYIGSHTCKELASNGLVPVSLDNLVYGHREFVQWGPFVQGDIADGRLLDALFAEHRFAAVIHFAAFAYVGESVQDPGKYYRNNVAGTISLLEAMRRGGCSDIIFSSTCATYGMPDADLIGEETRQEPINPYGRGKLMVETILRDYQAAYGIRHGILRYFNAAGADPDGAIGERHDPETHLVPLAIRAALGQAGPLTIFGSDYPTPDGTAIRDYIHVTDLADAHVRALTHLRRERASVVCNLGTGRGSSVQEVIETVAAIAGREVPVLRGARRPGDPPRLVSANGRAREVLGWVPQRSAIATIVADAWNWHSREG
ncbi:UDP-glucose 4-epimerase GalE [Desulfoprunum benzoelyticum]|uniref:UDP-glucose 4-epimerase n=1 Tax=Desulfoprunum benzoelyticum TaxID=1506996 RepID=A0A840ULN2_9BACT|nr:UDP-glucose 4-epimerase GalE [Desulfoprunum benzoelyticum]MBB5347217.1 UDP-glucose-4-epimerase GalE [Desulfoprunum benzoelyticum]MBM9530457.1 UDP-glucose 4-epimerase GalE [Desulfoprunum benzoelyticum]